MAGLHGSGISFEKACACNPNGWPNNPKVAPGDQANHCCDLKPGPPPPSDPHLEKGRCSFLYETIEGGPQDDERWRTGANVGCFAYTAGAGLFNYGDQSPANQHPCEEIAFASISNQMLLQPNGASFVKDGMLGVGYVRTPLGELTARCHRSALRAPLEQKTTRVPPAVDCARPRLGRVFCCSSHAANEPQPDVPCRHGQARPAPTTNATSGR